VEHIKAVDRDGTLFSMQMGKEKTDVKIHLPTVYNVYNACAAVCGFLAFAGQINKAGKTIVSPEQIVDALFSVRPSFGRMESFDLNGVMLQMILVKNPASCDQVISYLTHLDEAYELVVCLNDRTADGHDISWIWDANYELFADDANLIRVYVLGDRAEDLQLRLKYAGLAEEMISRLDDYHALLSVLQGKTIPVFAMPNYTAMLALRNIVRRSSGKNRFWEG
jgi:UDP-N-acetylmuramyl tripeptide synthase